jgi:two-component system, NarL family, sensor histidine kinase BarA
MAQNPLKRVFGETKLELKLLFLFGIGLLVIIATAFWWYGSTTTKLVYDQNRDTAQLVLQESLRTTHVGAFKIHLVRPGSMEPTPEQVKEERQWIESTSKPFSIRPGGKVDWIWSRQHPDASAPRDQEEEKICQKFLTEASRSSNPDDSKTIKFWELRNDREYRYFHPFRGNQPFGTMTCAFPCHASPGGGQGIDAFGSTGVAMAGGVSSAATAPQSDDVWWIARVTIPIAETHDKLNNNSAILWSFAIGTVFLGMLMLYGIVRYVIVKPLRHLRDVSDAVTRGNIALRAEIHTGDEFEELSTAFNRMLRTLISIQDELRQANVNLDGKVDELAQVNLRLYEMNLLKSDFLATMSHELRTPLNSILGFSEVLAGIQVLDDKQKRYVQNIQKSGKTLLEMINDILDLAKMESGKMEIRLTEFQLQHIIAAQADMARPLAEKKNIDLETEIDADLPPMRQDQARAQQILNNLLSNAIKFTPEGGRVTVTAGRDLEDFLVLQVIDTGVGIAEEDQQVIFEKFRQGRMGVPSGDAMTREYSGSGLGLSIVKELCKLLGGEVSVASELGKGSTFTVRIPWMLSEPARADLPISEENDQFAQARYA